MAAQRKPKRKLSSTQKANARRSARKHGRSRPGLWENVNASKNKGPGNKRRTKPKGKTRPGRRSKTKQTAARRRRSR